MESSIVVHRFVFRNRKRRVYQLLSAITAAVAVGVVVAALSAYQYAGPSFVFGPSEAIAVIEGGEMAEREVRFPNLLPLQRYTSFPVTPLFKPGYVIEVDTSLLEDWQVKDYMIRVGGSPLDSKGKDVNVSYLFEPMGAEKLPVDKKVVRLKINYAVSDESIAHRQKDPSGEWLWLREIYMVTLLVEI